MDRPNILSRLFALIGRRQADPVDKERMREMHRARCNDFRLLIRANNRALEGMSEIEEALRGTVPFGMSFVRGKAVLVASAVHQMILRINALSDNRYAALEEQFSRINQTIGEIVEPRREAGRGQPVVPLEAVGREHADEAGPKVVNLCLASRNAGLGMPEGFVVTASAYRMFMDHAGLRDEIHRQMQMADIGDLEGLAALSHTLQQQIVQAPLPPALEEAMLRARDALHANGKGPYLLAVRSSALGEDLPGASAAGQYRSLLNVEPDDLFAAYRQVVAGKYDVPAIAYRFNRGIRDDDVDMCVCCMVMVDAVAGGVAYSRDPVHLHMPRILINAVDGPPVAVVDGSRRPDLYMVEGVPLPMQNGAGSGPEEISAGKAPVEKPPAQDSPPKLTKVPAEQGVPLLTGDILSDALIFRLAEHVARLDVYFGGPQDVEWAVDRAGEIILLQCRPLHQTADRERTQTPVPEGMPAPLLEGGVTAAPGVAHGPLHILRNSEDAYACPRGAIAVVVQSLPRWAPVMGRIAGLVAEQGSTTGHLASVAREFGIPALFGIPGAVDALDGAESATLDADALRVYAGRVEELLADRPEPRNLMLGSPVHATLSKVAEHIVPLRLLDPTSAEFSPEHCRTFHDITRFCHEKAVEELFRPDERFPREAASRQLYFKRPMQYRVVDLDDGVAEDADERFVQLKDVRSIPMLALWEGMTAVPLDAPVPMDTRGFMSVLIEASANPELDPATHSGFTQQNYFMISSTFCNLQARFGFHFSTVEAQITDNPDENYATIRFKGGAADLDRRLRRVRLIAELLEARGFRSEVFEDALFARMEGLDAADTEIGFGVLGFIIMHSRQLDMVLANNARLAEWKARLEQGMDTAVQAVERRRADGWKVEEA
ncbi:PEP/pyruvate-binding domain-containing protein [Desulfovibrio psychrotolerans]|uniref:Phosphoenolpyruvate synthase n=1 Tax=Desulfovibrio psychrotolerans TaxID=415242 RepID=A0A7J0BTH9_9BACT|nr:PEP/pyruvate-binding domain-containing protein [Desulfovibrio psychrotolerans]GFM37026.1 phosphoenolpyruvate synthase [Desulfovibrio psychrotolerans]